MSAGEATLLDQHVQFLCDRAVSDDIARERGYRSALRKSELQALGFGRGQQLTPALIIPIHSVRGAVESYQIRPDAPRLNEKGKFRKYEMRAGGRMLLDAHPRLTRPRDGRAVPLLADPGVPLFLTEGIPKGDAAVSIGLCCVALLGVWNWRGKNAAGGKVALADWESIPLSGRTVYVAFDSDVMEKREVHAALVRLRAFLGSRGAKVRIICLPPGENGGKNGLDDLIAREKAAGRTDNEIRDGLLALAVENVRGAAAPLPDDLRSAVAAIMLDRERRDFSKRRAIAEAVLAHLEREGFFCRANDNRTFYFRRAERFLHELDNERFEYLLTRETSLGKGEAVFTFVLHTLKAHAAQLTPIPIHTGAYFDVATGRLAVSDGGAGVWKRERGGQWVRADNGQDNLLFFSEPDAEPFCPDFTGNGANLAWFLGQFLFAPHGDLSVSDQKTLLAVNLLHELFPPLRRTRLVPTFLGVQGSGKSSAARLLGRLKSGSDFDVTPVQREREDAFIAAVCNRTFLVVDNADSHVAWLEDALAVYATGLRYRLRKLYSTNSEVAFAPRASLVLTSRDPHFRRSDVAERLLTLFCERPENYVAEDAIFSELGRRRNLIWGEILTHAAVIADRIGEAEPPALPFRMADYAHFGWAVFAMRGQQEEWVRLLARLERAQASFSADGDGLIEALRIILQRDGAIGPLDTGALYRLCAEVAENERLAFPRSAQGFGRRFNSERHMIELELRCRISEQEAGGGRRLISIRPRGQVKGADSTYHDEEVAARDLT